MVIPTICVIPSSLLGSSVFGSPANDRVVLLYRHRPTKLFTVTGVGKKFEDTRRFSRLSARSVALADY
jgi:hypothetical protein